MTFYNINAFDSVYKSLSLFIIFKDRTTSLHPTYSKSLGLKSRDQFIQIHIAQHTLQLALHFRVL